MTKINTGMQRGMVLTVIKKIGNEAVVGYPKLLNFCDAFGEFPFISAAFLAEMGVSEYRERLSAFASYVLATERIILDVEAAYRENVTSCPI